MAHDSVAELDLNNFNEFVGIISSISVSVR